MDKDMAKTGTGGDRLEGTSPVAESIKQGARHPDTNTFALAQIKSADMVRTHAVFARSGAEITC